MDNETQTQGLAGAYLSALFLGLAPVLGKLANLYRADGFTVAAVRTVVAVALLWVIYALVWRKYIYIFPVGLLGCIAVGAVNGIGSLFYYNGLQRLDASVAQVLNASYLIFVVLLSRLAGETFTRNTWIRIGLFVLAEALLILGFNAPDKIDWFGIALMIGNAILFAGTVIMSQRVLYEMPAPTLALYALTTMGAITVVARLVVPFDWKISNEALWALVALGGTTALARLTLFAGVKQLGSLTTSLASIFELAVTLLVAIFFLQEQLQPLQWGGIVILILTLALVRGEPRRGGTVADVP